MGQAGEDELGVDVATPNIARMYDYFLGGSANTAADRAACADITHQVPDVAQILHANRAFLWRAVRTLVGEYGITQFLDLGAGIPTVGNVHEIAQRVQPHARVAYVDWEPVAVAYARRLLAQHPQVTVTQADIRQPETVLAAPGVADLLDFSQPIGVLLLATLDILAPADAVALVAGYRAACVPGSALALTNGAQLAHDTAEVAQYRRLLERTSAPYLRLRTRAELAELFAGYTLLEPGIMPTPQWRPVQPVSDEVAARANAYGAIGLRTP